MDIAKEAAKTIVDTLTVADRVAVVLFLSVASQIGDYCGSLIHATTAHKQQLIEAIMSLRVNGLTNFYDDFKTAFNLLDKTIRIKSTSGCNIAVLFMTEGQISEGPRSSSPFSSSLTLVRSLKLSFPLKISQARFDELYYCVLVCSM